MHALEELNSALTGGTRVIAISEHDVDLRPDAPDNALILLSLAEGSLAAGGRGGGFGERRVVKVGIFQLTSKSWSKTFETSKESEASEFEVPYYVSRLPYTLADGSESIGYGVVDPDLVRHMKTKASLHSSA